MMSIAYASVALLTLLSSGGATCVEAEVTLDDGAVAHVADAPLDRAPLHVDAPSYDAPELEPELETFDPVERLALLCALAGRGYARSWQRRPPEADTPRSTGAHAPVRSPRGPPR